MKTPRSLLLMFLTFASLQGAVRGQQGAVYTDAMAELGRMIFFDSRTASDNTTSCSSCHQEARMWTDGRKLAVGRIGNQRTPQGRVGIRRTPPIVNSSLTREQFLDLRAAGPLDQASQPFENPAEMGDQTAGQVAARLSQIQGYRQLCQTAFGFPNLNVQRMQTALVAFQRKFLVAQDTPLRRYLEAREDHGLSESAQRGCELFESLQCIECHSLPLLTTGKAANNGLAYFFANGDVNAADIGLLKISGNEFATRAFKIPTLIGMNVRFNQPLGHAGQVENLDRMLAFYNRGARLANGQVDPYLDARIKPRNLTPEQFADLRACLVEGTKPFDLATGVTPNVSELPR